MTAGMVLSFLNPCDPPVSHFELTFVAIIWFADLFPDEAGCKASIEHAAQPKALLFPDTDCELDLREKLNNAIRSSAWILSRLDALP